MAVLYRFVVTGVSIIMMLISMGDVSGKKHSVKEPENVKLAFSVLSDCHIEGPDDEFTFIDTYKVFRKILSDASKLEGRNDAIVFLGDNTMNGQNRENILFFGAVDMFGRSDNIIVATGNHDLSNGVGDYEEYKNRYLAYNNAFFTDGITEPYFYEVINGCYFIVLSSEEATVDTMYLSDTQLQWLKELLDKAQGENAPIFVMAHHPADYIEGDNLYKLTDILNDYDNLLYFCGHTHEPFGEESVYTLDGVNCINLPRCTEYKYEDYDTGIGAQVEVYEDEIIVRIRDFYDGCYLEDYEYSYEIK